MSSARLIDDRTRGRLSFHVANVYTSLYRLERAGFIVGRWVEKDGERRRRFYRLTAAAGASWRHAAGAGANSSASSISCFGPV